MKQSDMQTLTDRFGPIERVIETQISNVFLFRDVAAKQYVRRATFFGDLSDESFRNDFYKEDFVWNQTASPDIYRELIRISQDHFIIMRRVECDRNLTNLLEENSIDRPGLERLTVALIEKLRLLTESRRDKLEHVFARGWRILHSEGLEDLRQFALKAPSVDTTLANETVDLLQRCSLKDPHFDDDSCLSATIDTNGDNLIFSNGIPTFLDVMPVKESWRVTDLRCTVLRTAVDAEVCRNDLLADSVRSTLSGFGIITSEAVTLIYEIRAGLIQWAYRLYLEQPDRARKYHAFLEERSMRLKQIQ